MIETLPTKTAWLLGGVAVVLIGAIVIILRAGSSKKKGEDGSKMSHDMERVQGASKCFSCKGNGYPSKCFDCEQQRSHEFWMASAGAPKTFAGL